MPVHDIDRHYTYLTETEAALFGAVTEPGWSRFPCSRLGEVASAAEILRNGIQLGARGRHPGYDDGELEERCDRLERLIKALQLIEADERF